VADEIRRGYVGSGRSPSFLHFQFLTLRGCGKNPVAA
jgi:hypothetical protein